MPRIAVLRGTVLDVGGGRHAPHDAAWDPGTRRWRLDIGSAHGPDICADATILPIGDAKLDAVVMFELLEHVPEPARVLQEAHRVLRPDGTLLGSAPFVWPVHGDPSDYFRFTADGLRHLLTGFSAVDVQPIGSALSAAWVVLASRSRPWRVANPLLRGIGGRPDARCPEGWLFTARR